MTHSTEFIILFMINIFLVHIFLIACLTNIFIIHSERVKQAWERRLHQRINKFGFKHPLTRSEFVNELCAIWNIGMKKENAISGFEKNRYKFNKKCMFEKLRLQTFFTEKNKQLFLWPVFIQENMVHRNNYLFGGNKYSKL